MSGIKSKIAKINHSLSMEAYQIYLIQETWANATVQDEEIIANSNYNIIRHDRSQFNTNRINGGGLMTLIHNSVQYEVVNILIKTTLEIQIFEVNLREFSIIVLNIYSPPKKAVKVQISEIAKILAQIRKDFPSHRILAVGDFNFPSANWVKQQNSNVMRIDNMSDIPNIDVRFFDNMESFSSEQFNSVVNSNGKNLDLIFSSHPISTVTPVPNHLHLDRNSKHHTALQFSITSFMPQHEPVLPIITEMDYSSTKLNHTLFFLLDVKFVHISFSDIAYYYTNNE